MEVTEHRVLERVCRCCGRTSKGSFPQGVSQPTQYGSGLKALCVYLQNYQMLPFERCAEMTGDLSGHRPSTGSLSNFQQESFSGLEDHEQQVRKLLLQGPVPHADETGLRLNGKNSWRHVISNKAISLFAHHPKRGKEAMGEIGLLDMYSYYFDLTCSTCPVYYATGVAMTGATAVYFVFSHPIALHSGATGLKEAFFWKRDLYFSVQSKNPK